MSKEAALARGKANFELQRFLDNPETLLYIATLKNEKPKEKIKEKKKNAKFTK